MKKILYFIAIALVVFFFISNQQLYCGHTSDSTANDSLQREIGMGKAKMDSLNELIKKVPKPKDPQVIQKIITIHDKEIQHIRTLPDDSAFIFFSKWITEEDSAR